MAHNTGPGAALGWSTASSRMGGRDICYCMACGRSRSWKSSIGGQRVVEEPFDLLGFLGIYG